MVLIVAKCIVNEENFQLNSQMTAVLIVAKCIVNIFLTRSRIVDLLVLIVAKCIVNADKLLNIDISFKY